MRPGAKRLLIEGRFHLDGDFDHAVFDDAFDWEGGQLLLRREINHGGRSRCFVNDTPVTLGQMAELGDRLVDFHGQHDHQRLLKSTHHIFYLDEFAVDAALLGAMADSYKAYQETAQVLAGLIQRQAALREKRDYLTFQLEEIQKVDPQPGEGASLEKEERILRSAERISEVAQGMSQKLYEDENAVCSVLALFEEELGRLAPIDSEFKGWARQCESARIQLEEIVGSVQSFASHVEFDPERLEAIRERLSVFSRLKKKYGGSMEDVLARRDELKRDLDQVDGGESRLNALETELEERRRAVSLAAQALHAARKSAASQLEKETVDILSQLGLVHARFEIHVLPRISEQGPIRVNGQPVAVDGRGADRVQFHISLNPGQEPMPLDKVASGGEISRIMLALKSALAKADQVPILVFDEIDSGISGRVGRVVGRKLEDLARRHQILCITHLPQIASVGEFHYEVFKTVEHGQTSTSLRPLKGDQRVREVAKLLAGEAITDSALESARELLEKSDSLCS